MSSSRVQTMNLFIIYFKTIFIDIPTPYFSACRDLLFRPKHFVQNYLETDTATQSAARFFGFSVVIYSFAWNICSILFSTPTPPPRNLIFIFFEFLLMIVTLSFTMWIFYCNRDDTYKIKIAYSYFLSLGLALKIPIIVLFRIFNFFPVLWISDKSCLDRDFDCLSYHYGLLDYSVFVNISEMIDIGISWLVVAYTIFILKHVTELKLFKAMVIVFTSGSLLILLVKPCLMYIVKILPWSFRLSYLVFTKSKHLYNLNLSSFISLFLRLKTMSSLRLRVL